MPLSGRRWAASVLLTSAELTLLLLVLSFDSSGANKGTQGEPIPQRAMEQSSGKNLSEFFARWVYLTNRQAPASRH
jgi:hypothetical protein